MRKLLALGVAAAFSLAAYAEDPVKPDLGAGPHRDSSNRESGAGSPRRGMEAPRAPNPSGGASNVEPSTPDDAHVDQLRREDERKATESKEKMKKKPGYKEDVPAPRASK